ncbi:uncharacterized protein LOC119632709 [Glossina fuscipes]|uniref:Uncharacterized protein LOC119632709 n=1 Tax=Glossina fuscipes TaxID=7396 RepID=A0A8U0W8M3_9MUSC|nr:uncharacterized protein LOC119632709 [Glossina fuscipes]KAI9588201.1 hypothetical protein GQX74_004047 [Glossina fuscipes]
MPVAVRLVEVLALTTLLGILTGLAVFVVAAQRMMFLVLLLITPVTYVLYGLLYVSEKVMVTALSGLLVVTSSVGNF